MSSYDYQISASSKVNIYYFVCVSFGHILATLDLIEKLKIADKRIIIVTLSQELNQCWVTLIKNNKLHWQVLDLDTSIPSRFRNIVSWFKIRPKIRTTYENNFKLLNNCQFYCFANGLDFVLLAVIKLVARKNPVIFMRLTPPGLKTMFSFKGLIVYFHTWFFYGIRETMILNVNNQPYPMLADAFYKKMNMPVFDYRHIYDSNLAIKYNPISNNVFHGKTILLLDDDCRVNERNEGDTSRQLAKLNQYIIQKIGAEKVLYKRHPNPYFHSPFLKSVYKEYSEYPYYIPADFIICKPQIRYVIGGSSVVLSSAAEHTDARVISYLKLIPFTNEAYKHQIITYLLEAGGQKIHFPETAEELLLLIHP